MSNIRLIRLGVAVVLLTICLLFGVLKLTPLPPYGPFLDPASGIWSVARAANLPRDAEASFDDLGEDARVVYDRRGVPHIRAASVEDVIRALGYVVARDRLFQMEVQANATAGRLTEWVGGRTLGGDRHQRSLGLAWSAERNLTALDPSSETVRMIEAFTEGVNGWIDGLGRGDIPFEYHLLGITPERWAPVRTMYVFKGMGYTLTYSSHDLWRRQVVAQIGEELTDALYPKDHPIQEPIQPSGRTAPRFDYRRLPPPPELRGTPPQQAIALEPRIRSIGFPTAAPAAGVWSGWELPAARSASSLQPAYPAASYLLSHTAPYHLLPYPTASYRLLPSLTAPAPGGAARGGIGSNNWVVSPARSANGAALLSGDPHLGLTLPSIWYEVHLQVPGELDVYGVTIPGMPGVVIGFNRDVAWSFTNTGADVLDYYWETIRQTDGSAEYSLDDEWRPLEQSVEHFYGRDGEVMAIDTVFFTHRGPVTVVEEGTLSMRWTVLEDAGSLGTLIGINRASSVDEWLSAMESWHVPAQNGIVADRSGNIAIRSNGRFPIRPGNGDGTEIRDGTLSANDWIGYWPVGQYPASVNPQQGFLASANQQPIDPAVNDGYLGTNWESPWRAIRINELLRADSTVTVETMRRYHTDPGNSKADLFVPAFLEAGEYRLEVEPDAELAEAVRLLGEWDRRYTRENERAVLFENAMRALADNTWDELIPAGGRRRITTPPQTILASLLQHPNDVWWDIRETENVVETRDDVLATALRDGFYRTVEEHGTAQNGGWRWGRIRHANISHLLGFPALSSLELPVQGGPGNLNPSAGNGGFGASWRMVVELDTLVQAWVIYPGGQSGNPASEWYDNQVPRWVDGELDHVLFPFFPDSLPDEDIAGVLRLRAGGE